MRCRLNSRRSYPQLSIKITIAVQFILNFCYHFYETPVLAPHSPYCDFTSQGSQPVALGQQSPYFCRKIDQRKSVLQEVLASFHPRGVQQGLHRYHQVLPLTPQTHKVDFITMLITAH